MVERTERTCRASKPINPFVENLNMNCVDIIKVISNALWLFPIRLCLVVLPMYITCCIIGTIATLGNITPDRPLSGWRTFLLRRVGVILFRIILFGCGFHWIKITGRPVSARAAPITVACPHSSIFDFLFVSLLQVPSSVTRADNKDIPIIGSIFDKGLKCIFLSRLDPKSRQHCNEEIHRRINSTYDWPPLLIFPEGVATNRQVIIHFKHGAFSPKTPIQPVIIKYKNKMVNNIWTDKGFGTSIRFFLTLCQFHNAVEIEYLPFYSPSEEEKEDCGLYAENVRDMMSTALGMSKSEHTFEDLSLMKEAKRLGMPDVAGIVEFGRTARPFNIRYEQLKKLLRRFGRIDSNKDGLISIEDLAVFLKVPHDVCLQSVFDTIDVNKDRLLTFCKYVTMLHHSIPLLENKQLLAQTFEFFDSDNDGIVTKYDLLKLPLQFKLNTTKEKQICRTCGLLCECKCDQSAHHQITDHKDSLSLLELPGPWDFDQFKELLTDNPEYLLLFHECQNAGLSNPQQ